MDVTIYRPSKSTMQSGRAKLEDWVLEYCLTSARTPESLMGWSSSADTRNQVKLKFPTLEKAVEYARTQNWSYTILPCQERIVTPKNYVDNFKYVPPEADGTTAAGA
ncbi:MAG: ETC complex I subunit [Alphaproteobacteria bacterium]|nr:ETC complex I subunit [Alphaproteobacteria bacterium]